MDNTNKSLIYSDDLCDMYGSEQDRLDNYNEMLKTNDEEPIAEYAEEVDEYYYEMLREDYNNFINEFGDLQVLVIADLGLWYGRRPGGAIGCLKDLLPKMCEVCTDIWYNNENGTFEVRAAHHDGTNYFTIYKLSEKGEKYIDEAVSDYSDRTIHNYLIDHKESFLTRIKY